MNKNMGGLNKKLKKIKERERARATDWMLHLHEGFAEKDDYI